ncbi:MAG: DUF4349 domain-containing protein [Bacillota bacterium]|nr:DUF4349 domain-containing protein [Bacillota bacterium]
MRMTEENKKRLEEQYIERLSEREDELIRFIDSKMSELQPLPDHFKEELREKMQNIDMKEGGVTMKSHHQNQPHDKKQTQDKKPGIKYLYAIAAVLLFVFISYPILRDMGMGSNKSAERDALRGPAYDKGTGMTNMGFENGIVSSDDMVTDALPRNEIGLGGSEAKDAPVNKDKKIIENYTIGIHTDQFDEAKRLLEDTARKMDGFISSFEIYTTEHRDSGRKIRNATVVVKIPTEKSAEYLEILHGIGEIYAESKTMDDVTKEYRDIEIEIRNYEEAEKRYLELFKKAENIEDMLLVENELSRLRNLIDTRKAILMNYDYKVMYSTFYINLNEKLDLKPSVNVEPGMWEKAKNGFIKGVNAIISGAQQFLIFIISILPALILGTVVILIVWMFIRAAGKRKRKNDALMHRTEQEIEEREPGDNRNS